ncbi:MAG: 1-acyl-sn-glycerol-3-phosphate acyltransferase, partial [Bacteroidales bacterium]|nr:1-acyl-sn-glycerol-3-phosphate acyltransferase [Bacteroidales bacterium]
CVSLFGWKYDIPQPDSRPELHHCVIIVAPHTSVADYLLGVACLWKLNINFHIFIKKEFFNIFTRRVLAKTGAIAVDRGNRHNGMVQQAVHHFNNESDWTLVVTPEGTRKAVKRWKRGFYEIATEAHVPIVMAYVDYGRKVMGVGPTFYPTGDFDADMTVIKQYYRNVRARHPEGYNAD